MKNRIPCPTCGAKTTLKTLQNEIDALELQDRAQQRRAMATKLKSGKTPFKVGDIVSLGNSVAVYDGTSIVSIEHPSIDHLSIDLDTETCVSCGTHYDPLARSKAADACSKIGDLRAKVLSPLEALAHASNPSLLGENGDENSVPALRREEDPGDDEMGSS